MQTSLSLEGKRAIITGASRGIGEAIAKAFCEAGSAVLLTARDTSALEGVAGRLRVAGHRVEAMAWDLLGIEAYRERWKEAADRLGGVDILVNNAGVLGLDGASPADSWDAVLDTNLKSLYFLSHVAGEYFKQRGGGSIVNISSIGGFIPAGSPYFISKWGVVGFTRGYAKQMAEHKVRVNGVAPGPVSTRMMGCADGETRECTNLPLGRFSLPDEVASVVLFLAGDAARAVFGQTIVVNAEIS